MVEIESSINQDQPPFDLIMLLPSNIDSVFYVKKNESNRGNLRFLNIENKTIDPFVRLKIEDIELLRAIEIGLKIKSISLKGDSFSVDVLKDFEKASQRMVHDKFFKLYKF